MSRKALMCWLSFGGYEINFTTSVDAILNRSVALYRYDESARGTTAVAVAPTRTLRPSDALRCLS